MTYIVRPLIPEFKDPQKIDEAEYKEITRARKLAWDILLVKELFSYIIRNFCELENKIEKIETEANSSCDELKDKFINHSFYLDNAHVFNLLVMNLLTICRSYLELFNYQGKQNTNKEVFEQENDIRNILENLKKKHHDRNTMCNFFWKLRNYAQHHCSPIKGSPMEINNQVAKIGFTVNVNKILKNSDEKQKLKTYIETKLLDCYSKQELEKYPKQLNIRKIIKEYVLLLQKIHKEFSKELDSKFQETKNILGQKVIHYCNDNSPESGFEIFKQNEETQELEEHFDVCLQLINNWEKTVEKYSSL